MLQDPGSDPGVAQLKDGPAPTQAEDLTDQRFQALLQHSWDILSILDGEGRLVYNSPACERIHGFTPEELLGKSTVDYIHPEDVPKVAERMGWALARPGEPVTVEYRYARKDGSWVWMEAVGVNHLDNPAISGIVVNSRDITERKEAEDALWEEKERLAKIYQASHDAIFITDVETGRYLDMNEAFQRISGYSREQILGQNSAELGLWADPSDRDSYYHELQARGSILNRLMQARNREGGEIWLECNSNVMQLAGRRCLVTTARDVTERIQSEAALRKASAAHRLLEEQMAHTQKLESLGSLAGGVAHDMNNVLAAIMGIASVHQMLQPEGSNLRRDMDTIVKACQRGGTLVKGLLGFARQGLAEAQDVDLNNLVKEEVALLSRTTLQRVNLEMDLAEGLPLVRGDASALSHALMNLCVNAVDAMPGKGMIYIRTHHPGKGYVVLEVSDTGCGMSKEVMDKALDPFFTTKPQGKGTGLGLPIVYGTVKAHRGRMEIASVPDKGTCVSLFLPVLETKATTSGDAPKEEQQRRCLNVLVVDDDELVRESVMQLVLALGHSPFAAVSGEDALACLKDRSDMDLVILDLNMPGLGGAAALPRIREFRAELPVLLATGRVDQEALDLVREHSKVILLPKPFSLTELRRQLEPLCGS